jgi:hypothetical protein
MAGVDISSRENGRMTSPALPKSGWFPDPHVPGQERWWTGSEWSTATHRTPSPTWDWMPAYTRSFWHGLNRPALHARITGTIGILLLIPGAILIVLAPLVALLIGTAMLVLVIVTVVFGAQALRRAEHDGGKGLAIWAVAVVPAVGIPCALLVIVMALVLPPVG